MKSVNMRRVEAGLLLASAAAVVVLTAIGLREAAVDNIRGMSAAFLLAGGIVFAWRGCHA